MPSERFLKLFPIVLAALAGVVVLDAGFVYDDPSALLENPVVNGQVPIWEVFVRDFWGRPPSKRFISWRPLLPMLWAIVWKLWPNEPLPFHVMSAMLHVLAVAVSVQFAYRLRPSAGWVVTVAALFALHPLNTEAVSSIVAQADLLSFSLALAACTVSLRPASLRTGVLAALLFFAAILAKESAVILVPLAMLLFWIGPEGRSQRQLAVLPLGLVAALAVVFQLSIARHPGVAMIWNNIAHEAHGAVRLMLGLFNIGHSLVMTVWPWPMVPNHGYAAVELRMETLAPYALLGALLLGLGTVAGVWALMQRRADWVAGLSLVYAPALMQSHLFTPLVTDLAERLLYPSTLGISIIGAIGLFHWVRLPVGRVALVSAVLALFFIGSIRARRAWITEDSLWTYAVEAEPRAARHHHHVSNTFFRAGDIDRGAYHRLVNTYLLDRFPEAVQWAEIESVQALPPRERFIALPKVLNKEDPCSLIRALSNEATRYEPLHTYIRATWGTEYPMCLPTLNRR